MHNYWVLKVSFGGERCPAKWAVVYSYVVTIRRSWALSLSGRLATDGGILTIELQGWRASSEYWENVQRLNVLSNLNQEQFHDNQHEKCYLISLVCIEFASWPFLWDPWVEEDNCPHYLIHLCLWSTDWNTRRRCKAVSEHATTLLH